MEYWDMLRPHVASFDMWQNHLHARAHRRDRSDGVGFITNGQIANTEQFAIPNYRLSND
jgi:hypothetical protein